MKHASLLPSHDRWQIPVGNWALLETALRESLPGDTIVVRSESMGKLTKRALTRMYGERGDNVLVEVEDRP